METKDKNTIVVTASNILKEYESFREWSYLDSGGVWTYGYGFTKTPNGLKVTKGNYISKADSDKFIITIVTNELLEITRLIRRDLQPHQYIALISLTYNIGLTAFRRSTLLQYINQNRESETIRSQWVRWVYDNGQIVKGLQNRRRKEVAIYFTTEIGYLDL